MSTATWMSHQGNVWKTILKGRVPPADLAGTEGLVPDHGNSGHSNKVCHTEFLFPQCK